MRFYTGKFVFVLVAVLAVSFVFSPSVFAADNFDDHLERFENLEQNEVQKEIQKIQNLILEDNLRQAKEDSVSAYITYLMKPYEAEVNLEASNMTVEAGNRKLITDAKKLILEGILLASELKAEDERLVIYEERLRQVRIKVARLEATDDDVRQSILTVDTQKLNIEALKKRIADNKEKLAKIFNSDPEEFVFEAEDIVLMDEELDGKDVLIKNALDNSVDFYRADNALYVAKETLEIVKEHFSYPHRSYLNAYLAYINAENSYNNVNLNIENSVIAAMENLDSLKERLNLTMRSLNITERRYSLASTRYNNLLITIDTMLSAREARINAVYQKQLAVYRYNIAKLDLDIMTGK